MVSFSRVLSLLPPDLRAVVPDQRGHGDSDKTASDFTLDSMALTPWRSSIRSAFPARSWSVIRWEAGAQRVAAMAGDRVMSLLLLGSASTARNDVVLDLVGEVDNFEDPVSVDFISAFRPARFIGLFRASSSTPSSARV